MKTTVAAGLYVLFAILLNGDAAHARTYPVQDPSQLVVLNQVLPGDVVLLKNGKWKDAAIVFGMGGLPGRPVQLKAETPGGVVLGGSSFLEINVPFVLVDGLVFDSGTTPKESVIRFNSHHGTVQNTAIVNYNPESFDTGYYWVLFNGDDNLLDRCFFKGKSNRDPLIGNALVNSRRNTVTHCWFKDIPFAEGNGREIIRIWGAGKFEERDDDGAYFSVAGNLFDHADGEGTEIVSLKCNYNQVVGNTILATRGGITVRRGNYNVVKDNIVLGANAAGAAGIRITGEHNLVQGNYVSGCEYGFRVTCGEFTGGDLSGSYQPHLKRKGKVLIPTYPQVRSLMLADNVVVDASEADLEMGFAFKKHWPQSQQVLLPENCQIKNNRFVRPLGGDSVIGVTPDSEPFLAHIAFQPNKYSGNTLVGGRNAFKPSAGGFKSEALPTGWSESQERTRFKPLVPDDVGPDWMSSNRAKFPPAPAGKSRAAKKPKG